ncbi:MAG: glycosyltransferase 87 family protein [Candidatus Hodarchaeota archaeon]
MSLIERSLSRIRKNLFCSAIIGILLILHLGIVYSIIAHSRPVIWSLHNDTVHRIGPRADFYAVYHAGVNLRQGISPYANNTDGITPYFYTFRYLPAVAQLGKFLTNLPPQYAYLAWILFVEGMLMILIVSFWKHIEDKNLRVLSVGILLMSSPYFLELYMGQFTFAATSLVVVGLMIQGGMALFAVAVILKVFPLILSPVLVLFRRLWPHLVMAVVSVVVLSLPYFLRHPADWKFYYVSNFLAGTGCFHSGNYGFIYFIYLLANDLSLHGVLLNWIILVRYFRLFILTVTAIIVLLSKEKRIVIGVVVLYLAHFLTYSHVWEHHMSGVIVISLMLFMIKHEKKWLIGLVIACLVMLALPTPFVFFDEMKDPTIGDLAAIWPRYVSYLVLIPKVFPSLILFLLCMKLLCRHGFYSPIFVLGNALKSRFTDRG